MIALAVRALIVLVAVEHTWFMVLEMFLWEKPIGLKTFGQTAANAATTAVLAKNQGLYNGFLAAGLLFSLITDVTPSLVVARFFLGCVVAAGVYGGITVSRAILFIQAGPALLALALSFFAVS